MSFRLLALLAASILLACGPSEEPPPAAEPAAPLVVTPPEAYPSELAVLRPLVGQYPRDIDLWNREPLAARLRALLGPRLETLVANTEVQGPLLEEDGLLYVTGNKQHSGGSDAAAIVADLRRDAIWVWLLADGQAEVFLDRDVEVDLPADVRIVLENADLDAEPPDVDDGPADPAEEPELFEEPPILEDT